MTRIAFFGYDAGDAAVRRRVQGFRDDGLDVTGFMPRRQDTLDVDWDHVDLGRTYDGNYAQRISSVIAGARTAASSGKLPACDMIYARNLDMLAMAFEARRLNDLKTPVIYECLDVHRLLTRNDPIGFAFRRLEGALLRHCRRLVVSSPAFLTAHFEKRHRGQYDAVLVENRLAAGADYGPRPARDAPPSRPLTIGWVGNLRCARSLDLLAGLAARFGDKIRIHMHGSPSLTEVPDFHARVTGLSNVTYFGRYKAPEDLASIYSGLDIVWAGDFMEAGFNSVWLLPNRLYEGGYYAVPPIAPSGTETARWAERHGVGFSVAEDIAGTLATLVETLLKDRTGIDTRRSRLLDLPDSVFVQPRGALRAVIEEAIAPRVRHDAEPAARPDAAEVQAP